MLIDEKAWGGGGRNGSLSGVSAWLDWPRWRAMAVDEIDASKAGNFFLVRCASTQHQTPLARVSRQIHPHSPNFTQDDGEGREDHLLQISAVLSLEKVWNTTESKMSLHVVF